VGLTTLRGKKTKGTALENGSSRVGGFSGFRGCKDKRKARGRVSLPPIAI